MIVLDEPYASELLVSWLEESQHPVLDNGFARSLAPARLNLVPREEAVSRLEGGERVYTNSENALAWIADNVRNDDLVRARVRPTSCSSSISPGSSLRSCSSPPWAFAAWAST